MQLVGELAVRFPVLDPLVDEAPQLQERQEVGALVGEPAVGVVGRLLCRQRPLARVLHAQRAGDDQHLVQAAALARRQQHAADARIDRQLRQFAPPRRQVVVLVDGGEFRQQLVAVGDRPARRRLHERELARFAELQRLHAQDHRRQRGAQHLRVGELRPLAELRFVVQADADARGDPAAAAGPLVGRRLRDRLDAQLFDLVAVRVALHARQPGVDDEADAGHGERGFGDVGRQHDAPAGGAGPKHALLLFDRQPRIQRQDLGGRRMVLAQRLGRLADFALPRQKDEHVAAAGAGALVDRIDDAVHQRAVVGVVLVPHRPVAQLDRIEPPGDVDDRRRRAVGAEVRRETLGVDRRRGDDELQVRPPRQQLLEIAEQEVDVEAALVRLVDDDRVVGGQVAIGLRFGEQDAVGHQLDRRARLRAVGESHLVADHLAGRRGKLLRDPARDGRGGDAARLRVADEPGLPTAKFEADLRQLRGLARAGLAADDDDRVRRDCARDLVPPAADRQRFGIGDRRDRVARARAADGDGHGMRRGARCERIDRA